MITFTQSQLGLTDAVLAGVVTQLANTANPDPIGDAIARALQKVRDYTLRYAIEDERFARLTRALVLWDLFSNPGLGTTPPQAMQTDYKAAMQELQDIRDGKFHDLIQLSPEDPALSAALGQFGSSHHLNPSRGGGGFGRMD